MDALNPNSKNLRRNTSVLIQTDKDKNILIDCGKFFFQSAIQWFPFHKIKKIDSVLITHDHADALNGLG